MNATETAHTHAGRKEATGYARRGRLYGHDLAVAGRWHAVNADRSVPGGRGYRALCGEVVHDNGGYDATGYDVARNVVAADRQPVTCARCLAKMGAAE